MQKTTEILTYPAVGDIISDNNTIVFRDGFMDFLRVKALWSEKQGMQLLRRDTGEEYIFIHYLTPAELMLDGVWVNAKAGSCIFYDKHSFQFFRTPDCDLLHDWFHATGDCADIMKRYGLEFNRLYCPSEGKFITRIIQEIEYEQLNRGMNYKNICALKAEELLAKIARSVAEGGVSGADAETRKSFIALRARLHREFDKNWSVERMAKEVNLSPSRFHNLYKQLFSVSPQKDLTRIRTEHAEVLLLQSSYSVSQIAFLTGYNNQYHFIRQFKLFTGLTPGKYRKDSLSC